MSKVEADIKVTSVTLELDGEEAEQLAAVLYHMDTSNNLALDSLSYKLEEHFPRLGPDWAIVSEKGGKYVSPLLVRYPPEED